jgi:glycosyltransferase involved in cell wall biosynthesis
VIYVCIPTHDEAATLGVLIWKTRKVMGEFGRDFHVVVHDDASTDDTPQVLARYQRALPLTVLRADKRVGYARSVEALLRHVQADAAYPKRDCAVVMQADFSEDPLDAVALVKAIEGGADIVAAGAPAVDPSTVPRGVKAVRWLARKLLKGGALTSVSDPLVGLRAYRVIVLKKALRDRAEPLVTSEGWVANAELLDKLVPHARRIAEVPLEARRSKRVRPTRFRTWPTLLSLAKVRGSLSRGPRPEVT